MSVLKACCHMKCLSHVRPHRNGTDFALNILQFPTVTVILPVFCTPSFIYHRCHIILAIDSFDMAQAGSHQSVTPEEWVWSKVSPCGICGGQSGSVHLAKTVWCEFWRVEFSADFVRLWLKFRLRAVLWGHKDKLWVLGMRNWGGGGPLVLKGGEEG